MRVTIPSLIVCWLVFLINGKANPAQLFKTACLAPLSWAKHAIVESWAGRASPFIEKTYYPMAETSQTQSGKVLFPTWPRRKISMQKYDI